MIVEAEPVFELRGIEKRFPGVHALAGVNLTLHAGRMLALLGENGAGKSTLMNIASGALQPDEGQIVLAGTPIRFSAPHDAQAAGVVMINQELSVLPNLTVAENVFLGREPRDRWGLVDYATLYARTRDLLARVALDVPPETEVETLRVGQQQLVEVARAISQRTRVLIMDEPTSALSLHEVDVLFRLMNQLKRDGVAIVYITHRLEELARLTDDVLIMRDGRIVGEGPSTAFRPDEIVRLMVGRETPPAPAAKVTTASTVVLQVDRLPVAGFPHEVSLELRRGEIVGLFGLVGAGRTELLETIIGAQPAHAGRVLVDGSAVKLNSPRDAIRRGLAFAPEDRKHDGLVPEETVHENAALATSALGGGAWLHRARERAAFLPLFDRMGLRRSALDQPARTLSGGNQQKVILAKWLSIQPRVLLLDEPTRGIDVGTRREIYAVIDELARGGMAILFASSDLPEVLALAHRVLVMCEGRVTAEFSREAATAEAVMRAALPRAA